MRADRNFFKKISQKIDINGISKLIVVTHINSEVSIFLDALSEKIEIAGIIPKSSARHLSEINKFKYFDAIFKISKKEIIKKPVNLLKLVNKNVGNNSFAVMDMGGYFSYPYGQLFDFFNGKLVGIVEDTENGHKKYEHVIKAIDIKKQIPVISVARSLLKDPEDSLVGEAIVFSAEAILRKRRTLLIGKKILVIGFGKIGSAICRSLLKRSLHVAILEIDPIRLASALSQGMHSGFKKDLLEDADLIFCATGNKCLSLDDLEYFKNSSYLFCATSSDDEIKDCFRNLFINKKTNDYVTEVKFKNKVIFICNNGDPVNFLHGGVVGGFIRLVQAEMFVALSHLKNSNLNSIHQVPMLDKQLIAKNWITSYTNLM